MKSFTSPLRLRNGLVLKNRLVKGQTEGLASLDNTVTDEMIHLYSEYANRSDVGLMITGNVLIDRRFLRRPRNLAIDRDYQEDGVEQLEQLKRLVKAAKQNNTKIFCQLNHVGRFALADVSKTCLAPSAVTQKGKIKTYAKAQEMTVAEIEDVIDRFAFSAKKCEEAGFDGIQLHYAYGFLLVSFLRPEFNLRTDHYGGSLENRLRILFEVVKRIREEVSEDFLLSIKFSSRELSASGLSPEDAAEVAAKLADMGVDLFEVIGGNYEKSTSFEEADNVSAGEQYYYDFVTTLRKEFKSRGIEAHILLTGQFRTRDGIKRVFENDDGDLVGIAKPLCVDLECTRKLLNGEIDQLPDPDKHWKMNFWKGLKKQNWFRGMKTACVELTLCQNLIDIGHGRFQTQSDTEYPNLFLTASNMLSVEAEEAKQVQL